MQSEKCDCFYRSKIMNLKAIHNFINAVAINDNFSKNIAALFGTAMTRMR